MGIEDFIQFQLKKLERSLQYNQMVINDIDINEHIRNDIAATRKLMEVLSNMEQLSSDSDEGPWQQQFIDEAWRAVAYRWRGHEGYRQEWMPD